MMWAIEDRQDALSEFAGDRQPVRLDTMPTRAHVEALMPQVIEMPVSQSRPTSLTVRELEVLRLVAQGLTDAEVAERSSMARRTVNTHLTSIDTKLAVGLPAAAATWAVKHGLA